MVPSFVHTTVVAGEVVEVQIRLAAILRSDVTTGAAKDKESVMSLITVSVNCHNYRLQHIQKLEPLTVESIRVYSKV